MRPTFAVRPAAAASALSLLSVVACMPSVTIKESTLQRATAGVVGCPSSEIQVSGYPRSVKAGEGPVEWRAECRGRRFVCSAAGSVASCAPELPDAK
jgi:hypothetical protein